MKFKDIAKSIRTESVNTKKMLRDNRFGQQGEVLHEIDFNRAEVIRGILDAPIGCGFEAETVWANVHRGNSELHADDWMDELEWIHVRDIIHDQLGQSATDDIYAEYTEWIHNEIYPDVYHDIMTRAIENNIDYVPSKKEFITNFFIVNDPDKWESVKRKFLDTRSEKNKEIEDYDAWTDDNWAMMFATEGFVEKQYSEEYTIWLHDWLSDSVMEEALDTAYEQNDMDDFIKAEYDGSNEGLLNQWGITITPPQSTKVGLKAVAKMLEGWTEKASKFTRVEWSDKYHGTHGGTSQDFWRLEPDPSIRGNGEHGEIISPVYSSLREMLDEMNSLFDFFEENSVETNESTGLHVTLSLTDEHESKPNHLKMALLLGDRYLLKQFKREDNTYTKSQHKNIIATLRREGDTSDESLEQLEELLSRGVSSEKYSSMNIKDTENDSGNTLFEFRIVGGSSYHGRFKDVAKACIRYGVVLQAGYDKDAYREDYIKAIIRTMDERVELSPEEKKLQDAIPETPLKKLIDILVTDRFEKPRFRSHLQGQQNSDTLKYIINSLIRLYRENKLMNGKLGQRNGMKPPAQVSRLLRASFIQFNLTPREYIEQSGEEFKAKATKFLNIMLGYEEPQKATVINYTRHHTIMFLPMAEYRKLEAQQPIDPSTIVVVPEHDWFEANHAYIDLLNLERGNTVTAAMTDEDKVKQIINNFTAKYFDPIPAIKLWDEEVPFSEWPEDIYNIVRVNGSIEDQLEAQGIYLESASHDKRKKSIMETLKSSRIKRKTLTEASYKGNIGMMELMYFLNNASKKQLDLFDELVAAKEDSKVWELVQSVTGVKLQGKQFESVATLLENMDIPREKMPQLKIHDLKSQFKIKQGMVTLSKLSTSQEERIPEKIEGIKKKILNGEEVSPIIIDKNGYVIDGHHRYSAYQELGINKVSAYMVVNATAIEIIDKYQHKAEKAA